MGNTRVSRGDEDVVKVLVHLTLRTGANSKWRLSRNKIMAKSPKLSLTGPDALEKMSADIRLIAREVGFGKMFYPCKANPSIECEVHNGLITQIAISFTGTMNPPDMQKKYRSD